MTLQKSSKYITCSCSLPYQSWMYYHIINITMDTNFLIDSVKIIFSRIHQFEANEIEIHENNCWQNHGNYKLKSVMRNSFKFSYTYLMAFQDIIHSWYLKYTRRKNLRSDPPPLKWSCNAVHDHHPSLFPLAEVNLLTIVGTARTVTVWEK